MARDHWQLAWDMNGDGVFTISDVGAWISVGGAWLKWLFFLPGNTVLWMLMENSGLQFIGQFFEISPEWYWGWGTGIVSVVCWLIGLTMIGVLVREFVDWIKDVLHWVGKHFPFA